MLHHRDLPELKRTPRPECRMGCFYVSDIMMEQHWDYVLLVMAHVVPLQVQFRVDLHAYEFIAHSELFEVTPRGTKAPEYECIFSRVQGANDEPPTYTFEFKRRGS